MMTMAPKQNPHFKLGMSSHPIPSPHQKNNSSQIRTWSAKADIKPKAFSIVKRMKDGL